MNGFRLENPMCRRDIRTLREGVDYWNKMETMPSGSKVKVTRFRDGYIEVESRQIFSWL